MQTKPDHSHPIIEILKQNLTARGVPPCDDPSLSSFLDSYALYQHLDIAAVLKERLAQNPEDTSLISAFLRSAAIIERTRARITRAQAPKRTYESPDFDEAVNFLYSELCRGERIASEVMASARSLGISVRTLKRAKAHLKVESSYRMHRDEPGFWTWLFPQFFCPLPSPLSA